LQRPEVKLHVASPARSRLLGVLLLALGLAVLTGLDKVVETWAVRWMPGWAFLYLVRRCVGA
jgi:hypothetical protein